MRHRVAHRKLGRVTEHRISMLRNQASTLLRHGRIRTTVARGKELRPFVERLISIAKRSLTAPEGSNKGVSARRMVARDIADRAVVTELFNNIAPRYADRAGGYTRLLRMGNRRGDAAEIAEVELLGSEFNPNAAADAEKAAGGAAPKKKSVGGRLRDALTGGRKKDDKGDNVKASKPARTAGKQRMTTPRKAGGS